MKKLLIILLLTGAASAQCDISKNQWCRVWASTSGSGSQFREGNPSYAYNAWMRAFYSHDTGFIYLGGQANQTTDGTFCNKVDPVLPCSNPNSASTLFNPFSSDTFFTAVQHDGSGNPAIYALTPTPVPPFTEFSSAGDVTNAFGYLAENTPGRMFLKTAINSTDTSFTMCFNNLVSNPLNGSGHCSVANSNVKFASVRQDANSPAGSLNLDGESIDYDSCSAVNTAGVAVGTISNSCSSAGAAEYTFHVDQTCPHPSGSSACRGQRQASGFSAAASHAANVNSSGPGFAWNASPKIYNADGTIKYGARFNTSGTFNVTSFSYGDNTAAGGIDQTNARHQVASTGVYDPSRGRIWQAWGFQEILSLQYTWYKCIFAPASGPSDKCVAGDIAKGWQFVDLHAGGANPGGYSENDMRYVCGPVTSNVCGWDVIYEFGGLISGTTDDAWIFCLPAADNHIPACHTSGNPANADYVSRQWLPVCNAAGCQGNRNSGTNPESCTVAGSPSDGKCHGRPGQRDGGRLAYYPGDGTSNSQRVLIFGGRTAQNRTVCPATQGDGICWTSVAQWNPLTNDYCLSDTSQSGLTGTSAFVEFNGQGCGLATLTGTKPPQDFSLYFPDGAWDNNASINALVMYDNGDSGSVYTYTPGTNMWAKVPIPNSGPPSPLNQPAKAGLVHDDINNMLWTTLASSGIPDQIWELPDSAISSPVLPKYSTVGNGGSTQR
jgi:hypothetical protein